MKNNNAQLDSMRQLKGGFFQLLSGVDKKILKSFSRVQQLQIFQFLQIQTLVLPVSIQQRCQNVSNTIFKFGLSHSQNVFESG